MHTHEFGAQTWNIYGVSSVTLYSRITKPSHLLVQRMQCFLTTSSTGIHEKEAQ